MRTIHRTAALAAAGLVTLGLGAAPASAHEVTEPVDLHTQLTELNDSGASGEAWVHVDGTEVTVKMTTMGLLKGAPHAQHIHIGGQNMCPAADMEGTGDMGALQTTDAIDTYGAVKVSLTNDPGKTDESAALDVENYPMMDGSYERTFTVSKEVAHELAHGNGQIVVHGVDHDGSGKYDGKAMSDLDPKLPAEATDPAACGALDMTQMDEMPKGGAETGGGDTAGTEHAGLMGAGALVAAAGAAGLLGARRRAGAKA